MTRPAPTAWRVVWWFGFVSLFADMVYEGARSVYGPLLAALGASAVVVGLVTGAGEAVALVLRLAFGPIADRTGRYWSLTILGYGLTAVCVPLLALAPSLGAAGLAFAVTLVLLERLGKAIRSPSKSALLAHVASAVGRGRGFGVHKALDQVGAFAGPLVVAGVVAGASLWAGMAVLAVPGAVAMLLLLTLRRRVPDPSVYDTPAHPSHPAPRRGWWAEAVGVGLPGDFFRYAVAASLTTGALVTFGPQVSTMLTPGQHGSTFGGNPLACAAGLAVLDTIATEGLLDHARDPVSLDMPVGTDEEAPLGDFIEDSEATDAEEAVVASLRHHDVRRVLSTLEVREQEVIKLRYGLDDGLPRTLDQIGRHFGLSRERVRQIEREVMAKLREGDRAERLRAYAK